MEEDVRTIEVSHLGGSAVGYRFGREYDPTRPTVVMVNSFTTSVDLYRPQFADPQLSDSCNLLAVEPFGHGASRAGLSHFTYWDSAVANLQLLDALGINRAFVLGTSQGGWIAARMALLAPARMQGIVVLGSSMDAETTASRELGCWDGIAFCTPAIDALSTRVGDDWVVDEEFVDAVLAAGLGEGVPEEERAFWHATYRRNYQGDEGRRRLWISSLNLRDRDSLFGRLGDVTCPVLWLHGTADEVYSVANAEDGIARFGSSPSAQLRVVEGGQHFLSASHPAEVDDALRAFLDTWA